MQDVVRHSIRDCACSPCWSRLRSAPVVAQAQSGSAGGSIGNDEKSLSGSREAPRAAETPARRSKPEAEEPRRASRKSGGGGGGNNFDGAWIVSSVGVTCSGTSSNAVVVTSGKIIGQTARGTVSPDGKGVRHLQWQWHDGHHGRPPVRSQRRWNVQAIGRLHRKVDGVETIALLRAHLDHASHLELEPAHYASSRSTYDQNCPRLASLISRRRSERALAQSGSAGGSIGNDEKSLSGSREKPRAVESSKPARRAKPEADEPRRASRKSSGWRRRWRWQFRWRMGFRCRGHALRQQHREVCHLRRQDFGRVELRVGQPKWLHEERRIRPRFELEQFRPFLGPQRLRFIRAIRWVYRTLDRVQTVEKRLQTVGKHPVFAASAGLI